MLVIRFQRVGRKNDPAFRIVVTEKRSKPKSTGVERLGSYHPKTKEAVLERERILYWISKGAKLSDTVHNLLVSQGVIQGAKRPVVPPSKLKKPEETPATAEATTEEKAGEAKPAEQPVSAEKGATEEKPAEGKPADEKPAPIEEKPPEGKPPTT